MSEPMTIDLETADKLLQLREDRLTECKKRLQELVFLVSEDMHEQAYFAAAEARKFLHELDHGGVLLAERALYRKIHPF